MSPYIFSNVTDTPLGMNFILLAISMKGATVNSVSISQVGDRELKFYEE